MSVLSIASVNAIHKSDERKRLREQFVAANGADVATLEMVAGDASFRHYYRVWKDGAPCILMDAPPPYEQIAPFVGVSKHLNAHRLNAPDIYASEMEQGFVLLEDFGNQRFTTVLAEDASRERALYEQAIEVLVRLQQQPLPKHVDAYDDDVLMREIGLFSEWYMPAVFGEEKAVFLGKEFEALWEKLLADCHDYPTPTMVLRDFHADNLMWLERGDRVASVGLLDFQDALIGSPAYDVVSLLEDARREVSEEFAEEMLGYYLNVSEVEDKQRFLKNYAVLGAQRNMKIVGIFTRLAKRDLKMGYVEMIPRMWGYLDRDLNHPALADLQAWCGEHFSEAMRGDISFIEESVC